MTAVHIVVAMKPIEGNYAENAVEHGVVGLNIDESRVEGKLDGDPLRFQKLDGGWKGQPYGNQIVRTDGRWPANVIHDGSDEVVAQFPDVKTGSIKPHAQKSKTWKFACKEVTSSFEGDDGSAARFFKECKKENK